MSIIPSDFVPKYFVMNPREDDLIPHAALLREGMVVLIENSSIRSDITNLNRGEHPEEVFDRINKLNRWARVSHIHMEGEQIHFVGEYADGTKRKRVHPRHNAWIVKLDSMNLERDIVGIVSDCRLDAGTVRHLLRHGWTYVTNPDGIDENHRAWKKIVQPRTNRIIAESVANADIPQDGE